MFVPLSNDRLAEIYKEIVHPNGLVITQLLSRLRNKPYAEKIYAVTSMGKLFFTTASSYDDCRKNKQYGFLIEEKIDANKTLITMSYHENGRRKPSAEHQCTLEEAVEYIDLYVMRMLLEKYGEL
jgi:hypothetical protein